MCSSGFYCHGIKYIYLFVCVCVYVYAIYFSFGDSSFWEEFWTGPIKRLRASFAGGRLQSGNQSLVNGELLSSFLTLCVYLFPFLSLFFFYFLFSLFGTPFLARTRSCSFDVTRTPTRLFCVVLPWIFWLNKFFPQVSFCPEKNGKKICLKIIIIIRIWIILQIWIIVYDLYGMIK